MKKITFTTALLASACAFGGFEGHVSADGYVPGLQQGIFRNGGRANVNFYATCAEADRFSHTLGTILADVNSSRLCQTRNELSGAIEKWEARAAVLYEGEMYFEGEREYNFFGAVDNYVACQLDGDCLFCQGGRTLGPKVAVFSKTFRESGWHSIRVWIADFQSLHGARSEAIGFKGMGIGWNTNGCKIVNAATKLQWNRLWDDGSGRFLRSKVLPQKNAKQDECGPVGAKDGEVRTFGAQEGLPCEIEMAWVAGRGEVDGFWLSKDLITQRQWKNVIRDNSIEEDEQDEQVLALPLHLHMREEYILDLVWGLNARYTGPGRFACLSDAQWELAAKYCESAKRRNEDYGFRVALVPASQQFSTVTDGEGKETVDGYTWSYRVKNGEAEIVAEKDGKFSCAVSPNLTGEVKIPLTLGGAKVTRIGQAAFKGCNKMTSVTIPSDVKNIAGWAFEGCSGLTSVAIPNGVKTIAGNTFWGCGGLKSVTIPPSVTVIADAAFGYCGGLESMTIPPTVKELRTQVFFGCGALKSVSIPASVEKIGWASFVYSGELKEINVDPKNKWFTSVGGAVYTKDLTEMVACPNALTSLTIPSSVKKLRDAAIISCGKLESLIIPEGVTDIGWQAVKDCCSLKSVSIPSTVRSIAEIAFWNCGSLTAVTIPANVSNIGARAFGNCGSLTSVTMLGECPAAKNEIFKDCGKLKAIHVPANAKSWAGMKEWQGIPLVFDGGSEVVNVHSDGAKSEVSKDRTTVKSIIDGMIKVPEKDYWLSETELTQGQWESVMGDNPSERKGATLPVECVSRNDCDVFLEKLNQTKEVRDSQFVFSLPTEGEWLYATRAKGDILDRAWVLENSSTQTHAVATKAANEFGFYDMQGNVWEWLANDQVSKGCRRGGAFSEGKDGCSVHRWIHTPRGRRYSCCGLRVAAHVRPSQDLDRGGMEMRSPAEKLGQCDFLLNKDFKKNAKFYLCLFSASWCGPCRREMPRIAKTYADTLKADPDIELIHFSCDRDDAKAMAWAKEHDVKFPVVKPKGGNPLDLHTRGIPHLFIVKNDGTVLEEGHPASLFKEEKLCALKQK